MKRGILELEGTVANLRHIKPRGPGLSLCVTRHLTLVTFCPGSNAFKVRSDAESPQPVHLQSPVRTAG